VGDFILNTGVLNSWIIEKRENWENSILILISILLISSLLTWLTNVCKHSISNFSIRPFSNATSSPDLHWDQHSASTIRNVFLIYIQFITCNISTLFPSPFSSGAQKIRCNNAQWLMPARAHLQIIKQPGKAIYNRCYYWYPAEIR
jgi:hypothetical protein